MIRYEDIFTKIKKLPKGSIFTIKKLFEDDDWKKLDNQTRHEWGRKFFEEINKNMHPNIQDIGKNSANTRKYKKIY